jgi:hypothetical protein
LRPLVVKWAKRSWLYITGRLGLRKLALIALLLSLVMWAWTEVTKDVVTLTAFTVPETLEDEGFTGRYITNLVADKIDALETSSYGTGQHSGISTSGMFLLEAG